MKKNTSLEVRAWDRLPGETSKSYSAFVGYLGLGPARTLSAAARKAGSSTSTVRKWSSRWSWLERCRDSDADAMKAGLERQRTTLAAARQFVSDGLLEALQAELDFIRGELPAGDVQIVLDKHGMPVTAPVQQPDGTVVPVAVTRPAVAPQVRRKAAQDIINLAGIRASTDASIEDAIQRQRRLREQVAGIPVSISKIMLPLNELVALARDEQRASEQQRRELQAKYGSMTIVELKAVAEGPSPRHEPLGAALAEVEVQVWSIVAEHVRGGGPGRRPLPLGR